MFSTVSCHDSLLRFLSGCFRSRGPLPLPPTRPPAHSTTRPISSGYRLADNVLSDGRANVGLSAQLTQSIEVSARASLKADRSLSADVGASALLGDYPYVQGLKASFFASATSGGGRHFGSGPRTHIGISIN